ncbi:hypothetical protein [Winogradskyella sp. PG-2]|uniref:hypothetical protein n=1 Tax=Winogradskyella sp. PG-2 TaxID=754409 RepID=UPI0004586D22|nr:hypothetical protein [Winogradskyella sp. PG-2]BAO74618.1 hypothetical protein WPG_0388 [Winogradskyella sp. PG-2]
MSGLKELTFINRIEKLIPNTILEAIPSLIQICVLFIAFFAFNLWYKALTEISPNNFNEVVLSVSPTQFFEGSLWLLVPVILILILMLWRRELISVNWKTIEGGNKLRLIVGICVIALSWAHISYPFNYFLLENTWLERTTVLILTLFVFWRPFFLILYVLFPILVHFGEPLMVNHWSIAELPMRVLILFSAQLIVWLLFPKLKWKIGVFVFVLLMVLAGNYFPAGFGKIRMGWLTDNHIYLLLSNMYADGWVIFLSQDTLSEITHFLSKYNLFLKLGCLVMEFGCILILVRKNWSVKFFLLGFLLFHTLVFVLTGILFWPWIALEITLLAILWKRGVFSSKINSFSIWHILLSICLIFISSKWLRPSVYVWHDSPLNYTYYFEVEDVAGNTSNLPINSFWPKYYELAWTNGFHFLNQNPTLNIIWGVSFDGNEVKELLTYKDDEQILAFEKENGEIRYNVRLTKEFKRYMNEFINEKKYELTLSKWFKALGAPPQRIVFPTTNTYNGKHDIVKVNVYQKLTFFDGENYRKIRQQKVLTIDIDK